jgi:hypothetical protein
VVILLGSLKASRLRGSAFFGNGRGLGAGGLLVGWGSCTSKFGSPVER